MKFKTIATGSTGNCFVLDDVFMVDIGISFKKIKESIEPKDIKYIFISHEHGDHLNKTTVRKMTVQTDALFIVGAFLQQILVNMGVPKNRVKVVEHGKVYKLGSFKISPVIAFHDTLNYGLRIIKDGHKHFHITDTNTLDGIDAKYYNTASIECNHHRETALKIIDEAKTNGEFSHLKGALNSHLSVDKVVKFVLKNKIQTLYPVHIGGSTANEVMKYLNYSGIDYENKTD